MARSPSSRGIVAGIDGNPPLYLTIAWSIAHAMPQAVSSVAVLKLTNVVLTVAATLALYRAGQRVASALACWAGLFMFAALSNNLPVNRRQLGRVIC